MCGMIARPMFKQKNIDLVDMSVVHTHNFNHSRCIFVTSTVCLGESSESKINLSLTGSETVLKAPWGRFEDSQRDLN